MTNVMTADALRALPKAPEDAAAAALWWAARGGWDKAHALVQAHEGERRADWVHAYLHRVEGDRDNAAYWYRRAGRPVAGGALEAEWAEIAGSLLAGR